MGDHYIPRFYLRAFCDPSTPYRIVRYTKGDQNVVTTNIENVAQETGFYSPRVEKFLANEIEHPTNSVFTKIQARGQITSEDKLIMANYMLALLKRVPQSQERIKSYVPQVSQNILSQLEEDIRRIEIEFPDKTELMQQRTHEAQEWKNKWEAQFPKDIWLQVIDPQTSPQILELLNVMQWKFLVNDKVPVFITSDNPVFFHKGIGLSHLNSEITFPLSRNIVLWAKWRNDYSSDYLQATRKAIREINYRTVSYATRYVFYSHKEDWILNLVNRKKLKLHYLA